MAFCCALSMPELSFQVDSQPADLPPDVISMTLKESVLRAVTNNVTLRKGRDAASSAATGYDEARGVFDPEIFTDIQGGESVRPTGSRLIGGLTVSKYDEDSLSLLSGVRGLLFTGTTYQVDVSVARTYASESDWLTLNPQVYTNAGLQIKQPLLRDGWASYNRAESVKAAVASLQEDFNLETTLNEIVLGTIEAYWNLVYALEDLETTKKSLVLAENLLDINTRKMKRGVFTKMEVLEARVDVASKKELLITARNAVKSAEDVLKKFVLSSVDPGEWRASILPVTKPKPVIDPEEDAGGALLLKALIEEALEKRCDYLTLKAAKKSLEAESTAARNQALPRLDLTGDYHLNSLGSNMGNSFDDIQPNRFRSFSFALNFALPIGNRTAKSRLKRSLIELRKAESALREKEIEIMYELREAVRDIALQREKLVAAAESKKLSEERYYGEVKRLEAGRSITYQVREAESTYLGEMVTENRARLDYQIALAKLEKIKGTLLSAYGIKSEKSLKQVFGLIGM